MKKIVLGIVLMWACAWSDPNHKSGLVISEARIFIPMKGSNVTAGYMVFKNETDKPISVAVVKAAGFARIEAHQTYEEGGLTKMKAIDKFQVPAKGTFELKPGANHLMFFTPNKELKIGEELVVDFLENDQPLSVKFKLIAR